MNYKKTLVIVRHGNYGDDDRLDDRGRKQIENLSTILKSGEASSLISGNIVILSSTAPRAKDSAEILFRGLNCASIELEHADILWSGNDAPTSMSTEQVLQLIQRKADQPADPADVIIVVTHLEYVRSLPSRVGIEFYKTLDKGEMLVVDMATKKHFFYSGN